MAIINVKMLDTNNNHELYLQENKNMENFLELYKKVETPPAWALKDITGGRLRGKTNIDPQWRIRTLTEQFGICGFGWKYTIDKLWTETTGDEVLAFAQISLYVHDADGWSDAIEGVGGSMMVAMEKTGAYNSDECYKMAITDAFSVACKMLGIGAAIYSGSKYPVEPVLMEKQKEQPKAQQSGAFTLEQTKDALNKAVDTNTLSVVYKAHKGQIDGNPDLLSLTKQLTAKFKKDGTSSK